MLERAKASLKSGARETLRCTQTAPRSRRMLHSAFWTHGAGDLDLPPCAVFMMPTAPDLPLTSHVRPSHRGATDSESGAAWSVPDGTFLDFLYPALALSGVQEPSRQHGEQWEKRNARRLPEGFVQTSRGRASRSYTSSAFIRAKNKEGSREDWTETLRALSGAAIDESSGQEEPCLIGLKSSIPGSGFAISAADLAEASPDPSTLSSTSQRELDEVSPDPLADLRMLLASNHRTEVRAGQVRRLYEDLDPESKGDARLTTELLDWLSRVQSVSTDEWMATLYHSIPVAHRTLQVYQTALDMFLRQDDRVQAVRLHRQALASIENGDQVTKRFFRYAIDQQRWHLAMNIEADLSYSGPNCSRHRALFWLHVSEIPRLLPKALVLATYYRLLLRANTINVETSKFCATFFKEALVQEFHSNATHRESRAFARSLQTRSIRLLFAYVKMIGEEQPAFFVQMLNSLVRPDARYEYHMVHRIVSSIYIALRKSTVIPEALLILLLERLTRYYSTRQTTNEPANSVRISSVVSDWKQWHKRLNVEAIAMLMSYFARDGRAEMVTRWETYLKSTYPSYLKHQRALWSTIYVHARRADLPRAKEAFAEVAKAADENGTKPSLQCWNVLLHAYGRCDDLEGGLDALQDLLDQDYTPDRFSFHPILEMIGRRGDVEGVEDMLGQYDKLVGGKQPTQFIGSLLQAHINAEDVQGAEAVLRRALTTAREKPVMLPFTGCFNIILTAYAINKDIDGTMETFRWMQIEGIPADADTYAALILVLKTHSQTDSAYMILRKTMASKNLRPTAFHYALVMSGYINQRQYRMALRVHDIMRAANIRSTASTKAAFLRAKALLEQRQLGRSDGSDTEPAILTQTIQSLRDVLQSDGGNAQAPKQPRTGASSAMLGSDGISTYFDFLISIHGKQGCFEAMRKLYDQYKAEVEKRTGTIAAEPPIQLLAALMSAYLRSGEYEEIEKCWNLAKKQADAIVPSVRVPRLRAATHEGSSNGKPDILYLRPETEGDLAQVKTGSNSRKVADHESDVLTTDVPPTPPRPIVKRSHILSRAFRFYLYALAAQGRVQDMLEAFTRLTIQGYTFDNRTWNALIEQLCRGSPPLVLLAYMLTERFLMPGWPGWAPVSRRYFPNRSAKFAGLQYIRARYLRPRQLVPQYATMVYLGTALLALRRLEAMGRRGRSASEQEALHGVEKYVGSMRRIRELAPKTLFAVQDMPNIDEGLQRKLLRRETF